MVQLHHRYRAPLDATAGDPVGLMPTSVLDLPFSAVCPTLFAAIAGFARLLQDVKLRPAMDADCCPTEGSIGCGGMQPPLSRAVG
jgi:hypothetical protein